jgi:hypothetical protein
MDPEWLTHDWVRWFLIPGIACAALALTAWLGDRRRMRRAVPDAVGFVPWTNVFFFAFMAAAVLLAMAFAGWRSG